ncbi:MAG: hypothetical protein ACI8P0_005680 [Planctomycetaceae bacterium]|jgi:hypothetical protein
MRFGGASFVWSTQDFVAGATFSKVDFVTSQNRPQESTGTRQLPDCRAAKRRHTVMLRVAQVLRRCGNYRLAAVCSPNLGVGQNLLNMHIGNPPTSCVSEHMPGR